MEEQLVTFKTAKLAKKKGFENKSYHKLDGNYYNHLGDLNGDVTEYLKAFCNNKDTSKYLTIAAPTLSLLQKWLRDVHNIHVNVSYGLTFTFKINGDLKGTDYIEYSDQEKYWRRTYEKALEKGLKVALKLIKN